MPPSSLGLLFEAVFYSISFHRAGRLCPRRLRVQRVWRALPGWLFTLGRLLRRNGFRIFFLLIILGATDSRAPQGFAPLTIGLAVALINWAGIPVTNLSLNPARSTATAVFADGWALQQLWLFWVAPILGGAIAGVVYPVLAGSPVSSPKR
jgi:aquaporin Z